MPAHSPVPSPAPLLRLPLEILYIIISRLLPRDFEALLLSCRHVYHASTHLLPRHNELRRLFHNLVIRARCNNSVQLADDLAEFVTAMVTWPELAGYVRHLRIEQEPWDDHDIDRDPDHIHAPDHIPPHFTAPGLAWIRSKAARHMTPWDDRKAAQLVQDALQSPWLEAVGIDKGYWVFRVARFRAMAGSALRRGDVPQWDAPRPARRETFPRTPLNQRAVSQLTVLLLLRLTQLESLTISMNIDLETDAEGGAAVWRLMSLRVGDRGSPSLLSNGDEAGDDEGSNADALENYRDWHEANYYYEHGSFDCMKPRQSAQAMVRATKRLVSPLENLREVRFLWPTDAATSDHHPLPGRLSQVDPFLTSPHVRRLHVSGLMGWRGPNIYHTPEEPYTWPAKGLLAGRDSSGIEELNMAACWVNPRAIAEVVSHMPRLKVLRYSHFGRAIEGYEFSPGWDVDGFLEAVAGARPVMPAADRGWTLGQQMTDLAIGIDRLDDNGVVETGVWSLHRFEVLERLEIDARLLLGPRADSGERRVDGGGLNTATTGPREESGFGEWHVENEGHVPRLVDVLPPSLLELHLYIDPPQHYDIRDDFSGRVRAVRGSEAWGWEALLCGMREERQDKLPNLRRFIVHGSLYVQRDLLVEDDPEEIAEKSKELARLLQEAGGEHDEAGKERLWQINPGGREKLTRGHEL